VVNFGIPLFEIDLWLAVSYQKSAVSLLNIMRNYQQLEFWKKSHQLTLQIYKITRTFPKEETYGLISQMRRSSSSVATNIAEGCGRLSNTEFKRFLIIAVGSLSELHYQLILSKDLDYLPEILFKELIDHTEQIRKMIYVYLQKL
jgi:four helix bundle protein